MCRMGDHRRFITTRAHRPSTTQLLTQMMSTLQGMQWVVQHTNSRGCRSVSLSSKSLGLISRYTWELRHFPSATKPSRTWELEIKSTVTIAPWTPSSSARLL